MRSFFTRSYRVVLGITLAAALLAGTIGLSKPALAQQATPSQPAAAEPSEGPTGLSANPGQVKKEEAEEENVYRHTRLVQSLARMFHMDVETTARLFEWINAGILFLAILIPLGRFLPRVLRKRSQTLSHNLEVARKTTADANARLTAVEAQLARLDEEISKIRSQAEEESREDEKRIKASIEEERARIIAAAEQEIAAAAAHAQRGLKRFAADLAIEQAAQQMILTPDTDRELISEFIREATNGAAKGGQK